MLSSPKSLVGGREAISSSLHQRLLSISSSSPPSGAKNVVFGAGNTLPAVISSLPSGAVDSGAISSPPSGAVDSGAVSSPPSGAVDSGAISSPPSGAVNSSAVSSPPPGAVNSGTVFSPPSGTVDSGAVSFPPSSAVRTGAASSSNPRVDGVKTICVSSLRVGKKFYIGGEIAQLNGLKIQFIVDSASDVSVIPPKLTATLKKTPLSSPLNVSDFSGAPNTLVSHTVDLSVNFRPGVIKGNFYVCECISPILGCDLLRDHIPKLSLETGTGIFKVGTIVLFVKPSATEARKEFDRRVRLGAELYVSEYRCVVSSVAWMRLRHRVSLPPDSTTFVTAYIDSAREVTNDHSLLSFFDANDIHVSNVDVWIPSANYETRLKRYRLPATNRLKTRLDLPKDFVCGEVVNHPPDSTFSTGLPIFSLGKLLDYSPPSWTASTPNASSTSTESASIAVASSASSDDSSLPPIPLSSLVNRGRLPPEMVEACRDRGVNCDLQLQHKPPVVLMKKIKKIDVERELKKHRKDEYWPDKEEFLSQFPCLEELQQQHRQKAEDLLYSFRHIFFNPSTPQQFKRGMNITPVKMDRVPGAVLKKEKIRQVNKKKEAHLKSHISSLLERGVIEEADNIVDCFASNVHIVIEHRWIASKNAMIEKSRATADCREINKALPDSSYPLPNMEEFRRKITSEGSRIFSNFDAVEMYHQIPVDRECARRNFNIHALGKIYTFLRGLQGVCLMPSVAQKTVDTA